MFVFEMSLDLLHLGVETVLVVSGVLDHAGRAVRFYEAIRPFDVAVPVAGLVLALDVLRVRVFDAVLEVVRGGRVVFVVLVTVVVVLGRQGRVTHGQAYEQGGERDHRLFFKNNTRAKNTQY